MRRRLAAGLAGLAILGATSAMADGLAGFRWEHRVLALFADGTSADLYRQTAALLADRAGLAERDLAVFAVVGDEVRSVYGPMPAGETADSLRRALSSGGAGAPDGFEAVLVGKDGGVKHRSDRPIEPAQLNAIIDAMPMRRAGG